MVGDVSVREPYLDHFDRDASCLYAKRLFLFDLDGTINQDDRLFDGALDLMRSIRAMGGEYAFITNNSIHSVEDLVRKFAHLGLDVRPSQCCTATIATIGFLQAKYPGQLVYCQGTDSLVKELCQNGIPVTTEVTERAEVILVGYDGELTYQKLRNTCEMLTRYDVPYLATNPDLACPASFGFVPDCGSICQMLENATRRKPRFIGKPEPEMVYLAEKRFGVSKDKTVVIGDRLYTDIAAGINAGVTTVAVLTGEATAESIQAGPITPDITFPSVREMADCLRRAL